MQKGLRDSEFHLAFPMSIASITSLVLYLYVELSSSSIRSILIVLVVEWRMNRRINSDSVHLSFTLLSPVPVP